MYGLFDPAKTEETALAQERLESVEGILFTSTATLPCYFSLTITHRILGQDVDRIYPRHYTAYHIL